MRFHPFVLSVLALLQAIPFTGAFAQTPLAYKTFVLGEDASVLEKHNGVRCTAPIARKIPANVTGHKRRLAEKTVRLEAAQLGDKICTLHGQTIGGQPVDLATFSVFDRRLLKLELLVNSKHLQQTPRGERPRPSEEIRNVLDALTVKYGAPRTRSQLFESESKTMVFDEWTLPGGGILIARRDGAASSATVTFTASAYDNVYAQRLSATRQAASEQAASMMRYAEEARKANQRDL